MRRAPNTLLSVALVPLVTASIAVFGGAIPGGEQTDGLALNLSKSTVSYGGKTVASGAASDLEEGTGIVVSLHAKTGLVTQLATARIDRRGRWSAAVKPTQSGVLRAAVGRISSAVEGAAGGRAVRVLPTVTLAGIPRVAPGRSVLVAGTVKPAANQSVRLYEAVGKGPRRLMARATAKGGKFSARVRVSGGVRTLFVAIGPGGGSEGGVVQAGRLAGLRPAGASWYGLYGEGLACGGVLGRNQIGVAHKTLPCGTKVTIYYRGRSIIAPVIDRGPYIAGREFDLSGAAARALHFDGVDTIWVAP